MKIELRAAATEDRDLLLSLIQGLYTAEHIPFDPSRSARALDDLLADPSLGRVWIIEHDGQPAGYAVVALGFSLEFRGRFALLDELFIQEELRGKGAGRQTLAQIVAACRELGLEAVRLEVERSNQAARQLYQKAGFESHDRDLMTLWLK